MILRDPQRLIYSFYYIIVKYVVKSFRFMTATKSNDFVETGFTTLILQFCDIDVNYACAVGPFISY